VTLARIVPDFPGLYWNNTDLKTPGDVQLQHKFMHGQLIPLRVLCISVAFFFIQSLYLLLVCTKC
jgi:hypothetical protein